MLPTKNLQQTMADSQQRLVSLVNLFHTTNAVFCQAFGSTEHSPYRQGIGDWKLFKVMLSNYRQHRWDEKGGSVLAPAQTTLAQLDLLSLSNIRKLEQLNDNLEQFSLNASNDDGFTHWQSITKLFLSFVETETRFLEAIRRESIN